MNLGTNIRNFCIIAHIDHGKTTLSDRIIEKTGSISERDMRPQLLDSMDLERERGITIKLNSARLSYKGVQLNLIDTPGHADFSYEVSRSLSACEGAILLIDAMKGVQAQTVSNFFLALKSNLHIVVAINKIDIPGVNLENVKNQIKNNLGLDPSEALYISAKTGQGVSELLDRCISHIPNPQINYDNPLKALVFDSYYDPFKGAIMFVRVFDGSIKKGDKVLFMQTGKTADIIEIGIKNPHSHLVDCLNSGEVG